MLCLPKLFRRKSFLSDRLSSTSVNLKRTQRRFRTGFSPDSLSFPESQALRGTLKMICIFL
jgi:hypothetical protein